MTKLYDVRNNRNNMYFENVYKKPSVPIAYRTKVNASQLYIFK